jgi:hypothetical protein
LSELLGVGDGVKVGVSVGVHCNVIGVSSCRGVFYYSLFGASSSHGGVVLLDGRVLLDAGWGVGWTWGWRCVGGVIVFFHGLL